MSAETTAADAIESPDRRRAAWMAATQAGDRDRRELHDEFALANHPDADDASAATESLQRAKQLHAAIAVLPPGQREAIEQLGLRGVGGFRTGRARPKRALGPAAVARCHVVDRCLRLGQLAGNLSRL